MAMKPPVVKPQPKKPTVNVSDLLKKAAVKLPPKKGKDEKPTIVVDEDMQQPIAEFLEAYKNASDAAAQKNSAEALFLPVAEQERLKFSVENGKLESTVKLQAPAGTIMVSISNAYSKIDPAVKSNLDEIFGDDTDKYFVEETEVALNDAAFKDEGIIEKLIEAVGQENFNKYFKVKQYLTVTEVYHTARATDPEVQAKHEIAVAAQLVKCNKASAKPA